MFLVTQLQVYFIIQIGVLVIAEKKQMLSFNLISDEQKNEMQKLEEKARQLAEEAVRDQPKPDKGILFVRLAL